MESAAKVGMDSGRSWLVLAASVFCYFINVATCHGSVGVHFVMLRENFNSESSTTIALISSLPISLGVFCGPLASFLYETIGSRLTVMLSGILATAAFLLCSYAQTIIHVALCFSLLAIAIGINITSVITVQTQYFKKYLNFSLAMVYVGGSFGLVFSRILTFLIDHYGWRGAMIIRAAIAMQIVVCGALMKSRKDRTRPKLENLLSLSVAKDSIVMLIIITQILFMSALLIFTNFLNALMIERGLPATTAASIVGISAISNFVARLFVPFLSQSKLVDNLVLSASSCFIIAISGLLTAFSNSFWTFVANVVLFGLGYGSFMSLVSVIFVDLFRTDLLPKLMAMASLLNGASLLAAPRISGYVMDRFGIESTFYLSSAFALSAAIIHASLAIKRTIAKRNIEN